MQPPAPPAARAAPPPPPDAVASPVQNPLAAPRDETRAATDSRGRVAATSATAAVAASGGKTTTGDRVGGGGRGGSVGGRSNSGGLMLDSAPDTTVGASYNVMHNVMLRAIVCEPTCFEDAAPLLEARTANSPRALSRVTAARPRRDDTRPAHGL